MPKHNADYHSEVKAAYRRTHDWKWYIGWIAFFLVFILALVVAYFGFVDGGSQLPDGQLPDGVYD